MPTLHAYTVAEVSAITGISRSALYNQVRQGRCQQLRPILSGNSIRFPRHHINQLFGIKETSK